MNDAGDLTHRDLHNDLNQVKARLSALEQSDKRGRRARMSQGKAIKEIQQNVLFVRWLATLLAAGFALLQAVDYIKHAMGK